ncbi:MAG: tetratricopeptide repeat protein [Bacteroidia bacterium]|nr:tetratricopeptide repeat protein [Bacteroidia bacterium]
MRARWGVFLGLMGVIGCSAERNTAISRTWHTFVSYFNGYYHANQRFKLAQREIELQTPEPTEGWTPVFPLVDPNYARSQYNRLEEATKKCEVIIFRHKNGRYIDDSRTLIGQAWLLRSNLSNAEMNFNYVLNAFPETPLRPWIYWWQAYAALHDENPYRAETQLLEALKLPESQLKRVRPYIEVLLAQVWAGKEEQRGQAIKFLARSAKKLDTRLRRARAYYLLGQLYEAQNDLSQAYRAFRKAARLNPTNALSFKAHFQLSMLGRGSEADLIRKLERMAKSTRYEDYRDQIYYRIAQLYHKQGQYKAALEAYKKAGSSGNSSARALAHYEAGNLYFLQFQDLAAAQRHYDTAATLISAKHPQAAEIKTLQARFKEYALLRDKVHRSDSMLKLADLPPEQRERIVEAYIHSEISRRAAEKARQQSLSSASPTPASSLLSMGSPGRGSGFYFDNPIQVANGKEEFRRLWGERADEDHWRRSQKSSMTTAQGRENDTQSQAPDSLRIDWPDDPAQLTPSRLQALKKRLLATIPETPSQRKAVEDTLVASALSLAQLYVEAFGKKDSAIAIYRWLLQRVPHRSDACAPALYGLYALSHGTPQAQAYKTELLQKYPDSDYARLLSGKAFLQEAPVSDIHQAILESYRKGEYTSVIAFGEVTRKRWEGTTSEPAILYLIAAAYVHVGETTLARSFLDTLLRKHSGSSCAALAQKLISYLESGLPTSTLPTAESQTPPPSISSLSDFQLQPSPGEPILVLLLVDRNRISADDLKVKLSRTNERYFGEQRLSMVVFLYNDTHHLAYIAQFPDYRTAEAYIQTIQGESWVQQLELRTPQEIFPISQSNFRIAFTQKKMQEYAYFYAQQRQYLR